MRWRDRVRRHRETKSAAEVLPVVLRGYGLDERLRKHRIVAEWREIVGPRFAARTRPDGLDSRGTLWVRVSNSAWMNELTFLKDDLLGRINAHLGEPTLVSEVRFHLGIRKNADADDDIAHLAHLEDERRRRPGTRRAISEARGAERARIEQETAAVDDDELRAIIRTARLRIGR